MVYCCLGEPLTSLNMCVQGLVSAQELSLLEKENSGDANRKKSNCMECHILLKLLLLFLLFCVVQFSQK